MLASEEFVKEEGTWVTEANKVALKYKKLKFDQWSVSEYDTHKFHFLVAFSRLRSNIEPMLSWSEA